MSVKFMKQVQDAGWEIVAVDETHIFGQCQRQGCGARHMLRPGRAIPVLGDCDQEKRAVAITDYDMLRRALRERREQLGLTIGEVEIAAGMAKDHLAKAEKDDPTRVPLLEVVEPWTESLGLEIIVSPQDDRKTVIRLSINRRLAAREFFNALKAMDLVALLQPRPLPEQTLLFIEATRDLTESRAHRSEVEARRRRHRLSEIRQLPTPKQP